MSEDSGNIKKDKSNVIVIAIASFLVITALVSSVLFGDYIPGGPPAAVISAFVVVFATIAWATVRGLPKDPPEK